MAIGPEGPESSRWRPAPPGTRAGRSRSPIPRVPSREDTSLERLARDKAYVPPPHSLRDHTHRSRSRGPEPPVGFVTGESWTSQVSEGVFLTTETPAYWSQEEAMIAISITMPQSRGASERAMKDLSAFLVSAMKKRAIEISERRMTPQEKIEFGKAKNVEVTNFLSAKAFEALPEDYRGPRRKMPFV